MANKRMNKTQFINAVADKSGLSKKEAKAVLDAINAILPRELGKDGPGEVILPDLVKLSVVHKPATRDREGINPFTKEPMTYKAKPARKVVKVRPLKALTDAV